MSVLFRAGRVQKGLVAELPPKLRPLFKRANGVVRFKLGPASFAAGMPEPSLSVMTEIEWADPPRPPDAQDTRMQVTSENG